MRTEQNSPQEDLFQVGGCLPFGLPTYVKRQADDDFYEGLKAGEFCYVLNARQMGKSSLRVQTMQRLQNEGFACAILDIMAIGSQDVAPDQWYAGVVRSLISSFNLANKINLRTWWRDLDFLPPVQRLSEFIETVLLQEIQKKIIIFIDEIDNIIQLKFKGDFLALLRGCYDKRAEKPDYKRLTFALLGVATPTDLIRDTRYAPFNIGRAIQLTGFSLSEVEPMVQALSGKVNDSQFLLKEILLWTQGQPFLTQKLCQLLLKSSNSIPLERRKLKKWVEKLVRLSILENWESQDEPEHLRTIRDRILGGSQRTTQLLWLYKQILDQGEITAQDSPEHMELLLSGLVVKHLGKLKICNRIYLTVFDQNWTNEALASLRPYANSLANWLASNRQDNSLLLRGKDLQDAVAWAESKRLSPEDHQFLYASQALVEQELQRELSNLRKQQLELNFPTTSKQRTDDIKLHRLQKEFASLSQLFSLQNEKLDYLRRQQVIESAVVVKFALENQIKEEEAALALVISKMEQLEIIIEQLGKDIKDNF
jgi:hypothetical protein